MPLQRIFATSMNSRLLPQNKTPFGLEPLAKFMFFCTKMCANNLSIFVGNRGYHLEKQVEISGLTLNGGYHLGDRRASLELTITTVHAHCRATTPSRSPPS